LGEKQDGDRRFAGREKQAVQLSETNAARGFPDADQATRSAL
jgi:hypothetical protein